MKFASFVEGSRQRIGVVNVDTSTVRALDSNMRDMIDLIERYSDVVGCAPIEGPEIPLDRVKLLAPIAPRRNIFCVGKNYREHAKEFAGSGYEAGAVKGAEIDEYPAVFSKPPTTVVANGDTVSLHPHATSAVDYEAELAVVIGKGGRDIAAGACLRPHLGLHDRQRRDRARPAAQSQAVVPGKGARHLLPDGSLDHDRRRAGCNRSHGEMLGERRTSARREYPRSHFRYSHAGRNDLGRAHFAAGRRYRHRHACRRRNRFQSAALSQGGR